MNNTTVDSGSMNPTQRRLSEINWRYITRLFNDAVKGRLGPAEREAFEGVAETLLKSTEIGLDQLEWCKKRFNQYQSKRKAGNA